VDNDLLPRFSSFTRLVRVTAYCLRWLRGAKLIRGNPLSRSELDSCNRRWLSIVQKCDFPEEYSALSKEDQVSRRSPLSALRPFLSTDGLIRVGGRLALSSMDYAEKHAVVLAKDSHLSLLLVREAHALALHGGPQLTRSVLSRFYWIIQANTLIRSEIKQCVQCAKAKGATAQQQMDHLPQVRVRAAKPFWSSGVHYAGPIWVRDQTGRGRRSYKAYICFFVCMATVRRCKAVHL